MRRRSIQRPLLIYCSFFTLAVAISVVTLASLALLRSTRAAQREVLIEQAHDRAGSTSWPDPHSARAPDEEAGERIAIVGPGWPAFDIDLAEARELAASPEQRDDAGALPLRTPGPEAYVVYRVDPTRAFLVARGEIRSLMLISLGLALAFGVVAAMLIGRLVLSPLADLQRVASDANLEDPMLADVIETPNEVADIAQTFRRTLRQLHMERVKIEGQHATLERMQVGMVRASKLASVGRLAAGVAHEIGNPLAAVLGYLGLMKRGLAADEQREVLDRSVKELNRIHETIRKLLTYARAEKEPQETFGPIATGVVVTDTLDLLRGHPALRDVTIDDRIIDRGLVDAIGGASALQQVLLNLLINAGHALAGGAKRQVIIDRVIGDTWVEIAIADTGPGIAPEIIEQIFDPFFTTKPQGEGTGLGLAVSRSLMESMGGELSVQSKPQEGATFTVRLKKV